MTKCSSTRVSIPPNRQSIRLMFPLAHELTPLQLMLHPLKPNTLERYLDYDIMICTNARFFHNLHLSDQCWWQDVFLVRTVPLSYKFTPKKRKTIQDDMLQEIQWVQKPNWETSRMLSVNISNLLQVYEAVSAPQMNLERSWLFYFHLRVRWNRSCTDTCVTLSCQSWSCWLPVQTEAPRVGRFSDELRPGGTISAQHGEKRCINAGLVGFRDSESFSPGPVCSWLQESSVSWCVICFKWHITDMLWE